MADPKPKTKKAAGLRISAKAAGFRRAGRAWGVSPEDVLVSDFTKQQVADLKAEPMLSVVEIDIEVSAE